MATTSLENVRLEIELWRGAREKTGRIPNRIWSQAIKLLDKYSMSEICRALRLSHTQFKNKIKQHDPFTLQSDTPFFEVAMPSKSINNVLPEARRAILYLNVFTVFLNQVSSFTHPMTVARLGLRFA